MKTKALLLPVFLVFLSGQLMAQLDTKHWIPPFFAKVEDQSGTSNIDEHFVALSTPTEDTIPVTIMNGFSDTIAVVEISKAMPALYYFEPSGNATGDPATSEYPLNVVPRDSLNIPIRSQGLYFESFQPFFVNMRHTSGSQGTSLTSKGQVGLGTKFFTGHIYTTYNDDNGGNNPWNSDRRSHFVSVMATEDNTIVTLDMIKEPIQYIGQEDETIVDTLDALESLVLGIDHADYDNATINLSNGTRVTSTKPIVCNTGSWLSGNDDGQCIGSDQLAPASVAGQEYILVKGLGDETTEIPMVIATADGTEVFLNDGPAPVAVLDEGETYFVETEEYTDNDNLYILSTEPVMVFQTASGSSGNIGPTVGLNYIPPLNCVGAKEVNLPFVNSFESTSGNNPVQARVNIITKSGTSIFVNDSPSPLTGAQPVSGTTEWVSYAFDPNSDNVNIVSDSVMNVALLTQSSVVGAAGYFSGFTLEPVVGLSTGIEGTTPCIPGNAVLQVFGFDTYQWYFEGEPIQGATSSTLFPEFAGEYRVEGIDLACGFVFPSNPFNIPFCPSTLGAAKEVQVVEETSPGSRIFDVTYRVFIENLAPAASQNIQIIENIQGGLPVGATAELVGEPTLVFGILSGGLNDNFNGEDDRRLLPGTGSLPGSAADAIDLTIRVDMNNAEQDGYFNQVTVTSKNEGQNDGVEGPFNGQDFSHEGSNPDPDGDEEPNEEGENTPTLTCFFPNTFTYAAENFCISDEVQEITLNGVSSGVFTVDTEGLAINDTTGAVDPTQSDPGTYTVTFTTEGRCPTTTSTEITISEPPFPGFDVEVDICEDQESVNLDATLPGEDQGGVWTDADGNEVGNIFEPFVEGVNEFTYTITEAPCPGESAVVTLNVFDEPNPGEPAEDNDYCFNDNQADLDDLIVNADTGGVWTDIAGNVIEENFIFPSDGDFELTYTVSNEICGDRSQEVSISVTPVPDPGTSIGTQDICLGDDVDLFDLLLEPDLDGEWSDGNGDAVADIIDADELGEEVYTYSIDREPCEIVSEDVTINVVEGPTTGDAVTDNNEFCPGDPDIQLRDYLTGEDEGGEWTNADGDTITDIFSPDEAGVYEFTYTLASPECGLISTTVTITVNEAFCPEEPPMFNIPEGFSPNGDGINDEWVIEGLNILYPNNQLQIFNRWGAEVLNASPYDNDWDGRSDGSGEQLPVGTYWYILDLGDDSEPMKGFIYLNR